MPMTAVTKDFDALTLTATAELAAGAERVWELWTSSLAPLTNLERVVRR